MPRTTPAHSDLRLLARVRYGGADRAAARWQASRAVMTMGALAVVISRVGWPDPAIPERTARLIEALLLLAILATHPIAALTSRRIGADEMFAGVSRRVEAGLAGVGFLAASLAWLSPASEHFPLQNAAILLLAAMHGVEGFICLTRRRLPPGLIFVASFAALIALGTGALLLPAATPIDAPISPLDALFTATSAVCVTGLIVRDTASEFTRFGQGVILALIQLGGLGILFFGALMALAFGASIGLRAAQSIGHAAREGLSASGLRRLLIFIAAATLLAEAAGAAALFFAWPASWEGAPAMETTPDRLFHSVFFSVSAFCNAGFATSPNSLQGVRFHWTSHIVFAGLITLGGLGFPALDEVRRALWRRMRCCAASLWHWGRSRQWLRPRQWDPARMNLHARLVLATSLGLYLAGAAGIALGRMAHGSEGLLPVLADAHFMSVTARTAGFDTVAPSEMGGLSRFVLLLLMFIGGSPGSTAGGVKTIALAVLLVSVWATITGRARAEVFKRTIPDEAVKRAATLVVLGMATIVAVTSALIAFEGERHAMEDLLFEAVSACGTVGLSTGLTGELHAPGKIAVIAGMFLGRVGPLAVLAALVSVAARRRPQYAYPDEQVLMS